MPVLDLFTVKAMTLITLTIVSLATVTSLGLGTRLAGVRLFALGVLSVSVGAFAGMARVIVPGRAIVVICQVFLLGGIVCIANGVRRFRARPLLPGKFIGPLLMLVSALFFYWLFADESFAMRLGVASSAYSLLFFDAAASMFRRVSARERIAYWSTAVGFAFQGLNFLARSIGAFSGRYGHSLFTAGPFDLAVTIVSDVTCLHCALGMVIAWNTRLRRESEELALFDPLTNLPNRRLLLERLVEAQARALATGCRVGLIYLDLDDFKLVNDALGHAVGDELLRKISSAMTRALRSGDCLARVGGDEFVALIESVASRAEVKALAERLTSVVESESLCGNLPAPMRVSCGVAIFPEDGCSVQEVMREADAAMYRAKRRNRMLEQAVAI